MPYYSGLGTSLVYMSQYWHFGSFSHFACATRVAVLKILSQCFEPQPLLQMGLEALGNFHAKAQSPSLLGFGDTNFGATTFWATFPLFDQNGLQLLLPPISPPVLCAPVLQCEGRFAKGTKTLRKEGMPPCVLALGSDIHGRPNLVCVAACQFSCAMFPLGGEIASGHLLQELPYSSG